MWLVIKYKTNQFNFLINNLKEAIGEIPEMCIPKIKSRKKKYSKKNSDLFLLEDYLICYHKKFSENSTLFQLKYLKGLKYYLDGFQNQQTEIQKFVNYCKHYEKNGYISQEFFNNINFEKGKFISGPFASLVFNILERNKNKLKVLVGNFKTTINLNKDCLYLPI